MAMVHCERCGAMMKDGGTCPKCGYKDEPGNKDMRQPDKRKSPPGKKPMPPAKKAPPKKGGKKPNPFANKSY